MKITVTDRSSGLLCMLWASFLFSLMAACVYCARIADPTVQTSVVSFVRVLENLLMLVVGAMWGGGIKALFGDLSVSLWMRGIFGCLSMMLYFFSIQMLGTGESSFLFSSKGIFIVLMAPLILSESFSWKSLIAIFGSILGLYFLFNPHLQEGNWDGPTIALLGGFFAALSNVMVAKAGKRNSPECVVFYFCFVSVLIHLSFFYVFPASLPGENLWLWLAMVGAGITAGTGQIYLTKAYQRAPAPVVTAVGYSEPVYNLGWSILFFGDLMTGRALIGCLLVLFFGILLPFLRNK